MIKKIWDVHPNLLIMMGRGSIRGRKNAKCESSQQTGSGCVLGTIIEFNGGMKPE